MDEPRCLIHRHGQRRGDGVALTFDDGPNPPRTEQILAVLAEHGAKGTFFVAGKWAEPGNEPLVAQDGLDGPELVPGAEGPQRRGRVGRRGRIEASPLPPVQRHPHLGFPRLEQVEVVVGEREATAPLQAQRQCRLGRAPLVARLEPSAGACYATTGTAPNRKLVVTWKDFFFYDFWLTSNVTVSATLNEGTNVIDVAIDRVDVPSMPTVVSGGIAALGTQSGGAGYAFSCYQSNAPAGTVIHYAP